MYNYPLLEKMLYFTILYLNWNVHVKESLSCNNTDSVKIFTFHKDDSFLFSSKPVREFFCFDDPPGPHDSIEESRVIE